MEVTQAKKRNVAPFWTLAATLFGSATLTGWLTAIPGGNHDSFSHPNATSMSIDTTDELLYIVQPLPDSADLALGLAGAAALVAAFVYLIKRIKSGAIARKALGLIAFFGFIGLVFGLVWMSITYGTVDANIGGGLALLFGLPFAIAQLVLGLVIYLAQSRR